MRGGRGGGGKEGFKGEGRKERSRVGHMWKKKRRRMGDGSDLII